jgi:hypothetical protein
MKIDDKRFNPKQVLWNDLVQGEVYIDQTSGEYVMCADERSVVVLDSGTLCNHECYSSDSSFVPVKATLVVE